MSGTSKFIIVILVLAILALAGWRTMAILDARNAAKKIEVVAETLRVGVERVKSQTLAEIVSATGDVEAMAAVDVIPKVGGTLERLRLDDGTKIEEGLVVKSGQVIATIEHSALDAAAEVAKAALTRAQVQAKGDAIAATIADAKAAVAAARAALAEAGAAVRQTQRDRERMLKLCEQGSCTEQMRDNAVTAHEVALQREKATAAQLDRAQAAESLAESQTKALADAGVVQADAAWRQAKVMLEDATIRAPFDGVVTRRYVEEGNMVGPATPLARIDQIDTVKVIGSVGESYLASLAPGKTPVRVSVDAYPLAEFPGVIYLAGIEIDRATRTVKVDVRVLNADHRLRPGMFARMQVIVGEKPGATVVPDSALVREGDKVFAFTVIGGKARRKPLKLGITQGPLHEVLDGLAPGETVIVRGQRLVKDGDPITAVESPDSPAPKASAEARP